MSLQQSKQLREKRANIAKTIEANLHAMQDADEARKGELLEQNERAFKEAEQIKSQIEQLERQADLESELSDARGRLVPAPGGSDDPAERKVQRRHAMEAYLRFGYEGMTPEARAILNPNTGATRAAVAEAMRHLRGFAKEGRDLSTGTSGAVLPNEYWDDIEKSMLAFGGMREVARTIRTTSGNPFVLPTMNDTGNMAAIVSEASQTTVSVDPTLSSLTLNAYLYRSFMLVSREMLQDASFDISGWVDGGLSARLARRLNNHFTVGTGSSQPNGVATAVNTGATTASGNSLAYTDFTALEHSLDPAYRRNARWMFHDSVLKAAKNMVDSQSRPLWLPGVAVRAPDSILGYPFTVNQDCAQLDSGGDKVIYFGDFSKYIIRDVVGDGFPVILRLNERYADYGQVGFFLFSRHDGDLLDAGTDPIKLAVTPSP